MGVVVSHRLSLQHQLSCSFPPNFTPPHTHTQPCTNHPHLKIYVDSLFHPPALLGSLRETAELPDGEGFSQLWLCSPVSCHFVIPFPLAHCSGDKRRRSLLPSHSSLWVPRSSQCIMENSYPSPFNILSLFPEAIQLHFHQLAMPASVGLLCL